MHPHHTNCLPCWLTAPPAILSAFGRRLLPTRPPRRTFRHPRPPLQRPPPPVQRRQDAGRELAAVHAAAVQPGGAPLQLQPPVGQQPQARGVAAQATGGRRTAEWVSFSAVPSTYVMCSLHGGQPWALVSANTAPPLPFRAPTGGPTALARHSPLPASPQMRTSWHHAQK